MTIVVVVWVIVVVQLITAGINIGYAMRDGSTTNWIIGIGAAAIGVACLAVNAWSTYIRGKIDEMRR